jgi:competence ComEA-like helix-hairpin-helix protein
MINPDSSLPSVYHRSRTQRLFFAVVLVAILWGFVLTSDNFRGQSLPNKNNERKWVGPLLRLELNQASERELSLLPSIGPTLARRMVEHRAARGSFSSVEDLNQVHGVGDKTIQQISPYLYVVGSSITISRSIDPHAVAQTRALDPLEQEGLATD